jgi:hypothetical protein
MIKITRWALIAGAVALVWAMLLALSSQISTAHPEEPCAGGLFPTDPDFEVRDQRPPPINERNPDVAYNPDKDEYMVVFDWDLDGGSEHDIMAITVTAQGALGTSLIPVTSDSFHDDTHPAIAYNPDSGKYLVVWQRWHSAAAHQIVGTMVSDTAGSEITLQTSVHGSLQYPDTAYSPGTGRFLVVWESYAPYDTPPIILGTTLNGSGGDIKTPISVSPDAPSTGEQRYPALAANQLTGRWLVTWQDTRNTGTTGNDIYGQQVQYTGGSVSLWSSPVAIGNITGDAGAPAVDWGPVSSANGEFLVAWTEGITTTYARRVRANNTLAGGVITVSDTDTDKSNAAVAFAPGSSDWWVLWESG